MLYGFEIHEVFATFRRALALAETPTVYEAAPS